MHIILVTPNEIPQGTPEADNIGSNIYLELQQFMEKVMEDHGLDIETSLIIQGFIDCKQYKDEDLEMHAMVSVFCIRNVEVVNKIFLYYRGFTSEQLDNLIHLISADMGIAERTMAVNHTDKLTYDLFAIMGALCEGVEYNEPEGWKIELGNGLSGLVMEYSVRHYADLLTYYADLDMDVFKGLKESVSEMTAH